MRELYRCKTSAGELHIMTSWAALQSQVYLKRLFGGTSREAVVFLKILAQFQWFQWCNIIQYTNAGLHTQYT